MQWLDASTFSGHSSQALSKDAVQLWLWRDVDIGPAVGAARARERMRHALARQVGVEAGALQFSRGVHGKPKLALPDSPRFNLSHSGPITALALTHSLEVGVDVEVPRRRRDVLALAQRYFAPAETAALARLEGTCRDAAFYALWTCKEAVLKALGRGIAFGLDRLEFDVSGGDGLPRALTRIAIEGGSATEWRISRFEPTVGGFGALAWRGPSLAVDGFLDTV